MTIKELCDSEKEVRVTDNKIRKDLIKELMMDRITQEEKELIYKTINELETKRDSWEENNSRHWFRIGKLLGTNAGLLVGASLFAIGEKVGKIIATKFES